jgi:hypothetical protein
VPSNVAYRAPEYTTVPPTHTPWFDDDIVPALEVDVVLVEVRLLQVPTVAAAPRWNPALHTHPHPLHPPTASSIPTYRAFLTSRFPHGAQLVPCATKPSAHLQLQLFDPAGVPAVEYLLLSGLLLLHAEQPPPDKKNPAPHPHPHRFVPAGDPAVTYFDPAGIALVHG